MSHTPGPWRVGNGGGAIVADADPTGTVPAYPAGREYYGSDFLVAESVAAGNRELIAAAPELLAELKKIHSRSACTCRLEPLVDGPVPCTTCQMAAVIAKAEGRAEGA